MPLTDVRIRQAKPQEKPYRLADGGGLFLEVRPNGSKFWRYAYRIAGKPNLYAIGRYPEDTLQAARAEHARARALVKEGKHPAQERARQRADNVQAGADTFRAGAESWFEANAPRWGEDYRAQVRRYMEGALFPKVGRLPLRAVTSADLLAVIRQVNDGSGPAAAILTRQIASQVFTYAIANLRADNDPTYPLRRAIVRPPAKHADAKGATDIMALQSRLRVFGGNRTTGIAVELLLLLFVRTAEMRGALWSEFDLDGRMWTIPAARMKKRRRHMVPLPARAVELLRELHEITGSGPLLFPNNRDASKPMSRMTVNRALEYMGFPPTMFTGHDFRATASTRLHEMGFRGEVVEMQLAHAKTDRVAAAYNHAEFLAERTAMMEAWAEWLEKIGEAAPEATRRPRGRRGPMKRSDNPAP